MKRHISPPNDEEEDTLPSVIPVFFFSSINWDQGQIPPKTREAKVGF